MPLVHSPYSIGWIFSTHYVYLAEHKANDATIASVAFV